MKTCGIKRDGSKQLDVKWYYISDVDGNTYIYIQGSDTMVE